MLAPCSMEPIAPYTYTVYTHPDGGAIDGDSGLNEAKVTETFNPPLTCGQHTGDGGLNMNGQFADHISSGCSSSALTCSNTTTQSIGVAGAQVRTNSLVWSSSGVSYTSNGPTK